MNKSLFDNNTRKDWNVYKISFQDLRLALDLNKFDRIAKMPKHSKMNKESLIRNMRLVYSFFPSWTLEYYGIEVCGSNRIETHLNGTDDIGLLGCFKEGYEPKVERIATLKNLTYAQACEIEEKYSEMANAEAIEKLEKFGIVTSICGVYKRALGCQEIYTYPDNPKGLAPKCIQDVYHKKYLNEL